MSARPNPAVAENGRALRWLRILAPAVVLALGLFAW